MENSLATIADLGMTVMLIGLFCCFPVIAITGIIYGAATSIQQRKAGERLAPDLGLRKLNNQTHPLYIWYGGNHKGRRFALKTFFTTSSYYVDHRRRTSYHTHLRLVIEVNTALQPGTIISQNRKNKQPQSYSETFLGEHVQQLSPAAQRAMFGFSKKGEPTGLKKSGRLAFSRGWRSISLFERHGKAESLLAPEVLSKANAILIHDISDAGISAGEVRTRLDELADLAQAIETGRPARSLDPDAIPPEAPIRRYGGWIFALFWALGLPTIFCMCAVIFTALGG